MSRNKDALGAFAAYALLTIVLTWPLARGLAHDLPGDLGDPVLNAWIVSWDASHITRALGGDVGALREYWNANIFAPHPLALAYSEHLTAQAVQVLPVYVLTRNPILCYNLLFLSTFVLSAFFMFLLVRELTGSALGGFVAGLAFGFAPYRVTSIPHLQVLSSAWMPLTLFFFRRFFEARSSRDLAYAAVAWVMQNLSCGYYLLFFSPIVALYLAWELAVRRLWTEPRVLGRVALALAAVTAATAPMLWPYLELRQLGFQPRSLLELRQFSADVYGWLTASPMLTFWGSTARAWPAPEGELFPGVTITALATAAIVLGGRRGAEGAPPAGRMERALGTLLAVTLLLAGFLLFGGSIRIPASRPIIKITAFWRAVGAAAILAGLLLVFSTRTRRIAARVWSSPAALFAAIVLIASFMSFGPVINARGRIVEEVGPYALFYRYVPGVDGLRVPARFGMIAAFGLAGLSGLAAAALPARRGGVRLLAAVSGLILLESWAVPIAVNYNDVAYKQNGLAPLPPAIALNDDAFPVYGFLARLPPDSVVLELPLGELAFDVRYMFYSLRHHRPLVNGFSGGAPGDYPLLTEWLKDALTSPDRAWTALSSSAATHVVVHEAFYQAANGRNISAWLAARGAREVAAFGGDRVFSIR